jgi:hypothetical protein
MMKKCENNELIVVAGLSRRDMGEGVGLVWVAGVELLWGRIELERDECLEGCLSLIAGRVEVEKNKSMNS